MRVLLDTHTLLWWLDGDRRLPRRLRLLIGEEANTVFVSAASAWEISTKVRLGKLPGAVDLAGDVPAILVQQHFQSLAITVPHAQRAGGLPGPHRDPFDRMLIAQSQIESLPVISNDTIFDRYALQRLW